LFSFSIFLVPSFIHGSPHAFIISCLFVILYITVSINFFHFYFRSFFLFPRFLCFLVISFAYFVIYSVTLYSFSPTLLGLCFSSFLHIFVFCLYVFHS
jgi:hypothetical protein